MEKEIVEKFMISKGDIKKYFSNSKKISCDELIEYYKIKRKSYIEFNAIFNATPKKKDKKRREIK